MNKYQVTYTIQGLLKVFVDVVLATDEDDSVVQVQKLVSECGISKQIQVVLIVTL